MTGNKIQTHILSMLLARPRARYALLKPRGVANDLYNYHLQFLVTKGLVNRRAGFYSLTPAGEHYISAENPHDPQGRKRDLFKICVLTITLRQKGNVWEVLNQTRLVAPFGEKQEIMGGSIRKGETIIQAAARKLREETGLLGSFQLAGISRRIVSKNEVVISDTPYYLCVSANPKGELLSETMYGSHSWVSFKNAIKHEQEQSAPIKGLIKLLNFLQKHPDQIPSLSYDETVIKL